MRTKREVTHIYLAARYSRRLELCGYREQLEALGYVVTSRWLNGKHQIDENGVPIGDEGEALVEHGQSEEAAKMRARFANEDFVDVRRADLLISFTEKARTPSTSRGGRHVEFGIAFGCLMPVWVVGHRENLFHWHEDVRFFPTWPAALEKLYEQKS